MIIMRLSLSAYGFRWFWFAAQNVVAHSCTSTLHLGTLVKPLYKSLLTFCQCNGRVTYANIVKSRK